MSKFKVELTNQEIKYITSLMGEQYFTADVERDGDVFKLSNIRPINTTQITPKQALDNAGMTMSECVMDSIVPACCDHGCMVEPDGTCEHGNQSVLLAVGLI
jgi:hypothetical protein